MGFPKTFSSEKSELARILYSIVRKNTSFTGTFTGKRKLNKENYLTCKLCPGENQLTQPGQIGSFVVGEVFVQKEGIGIFLNKYILNYSGIGVLLNKYILNYSGTTDCCCVQEIF